MNLFINMALKSGMRSLGPHSRHPLPELIAQLRGMKTEITSEAAAVIEQLIADRNELKVDINHNIAERGEIVLKLSPIGAIILHTLHQHYGEVVSIDTLHHKIYGKVVMEKAKRSDNTVRVRVNMLKKRLELIGAVIHTSHGVGYQLELLALPKSTRGSHVVE